MATPDGDRQMDITRHATFDSSTTRDSPSLAMDLWDIHSFFGEWDGIDEPESEVSATNQTAPSPRTENQPDIERSHRDCGSSDSDYSPRDHSFYQKAATGPDGLYHCPWEGKDPSCNHRPTQLKSSYDTFVDSHLKPYRCKIKSCENARFSSTACLLRHEREAHAIHGHGSKPFLCTFEVCERSRLGNGFPRHWNLCDHMKRVHNRSPSPPSGARRREGDRKRRYPWHSSPSYDRPAACPATTPAPGPSFSPYQPDISPYDHPRHNATTPERWLRLDWVQAPYPYSSTAHTNSLSPSFRPRQQELSPPPAPAAAKGKLELKADELVSAVRKVRLPDDEDTLKNLGIAADCLKAMIEEVMKTQTGPESSSDWDLEMPD